MIWCDGLSHRDALTFVFDMVEPSPPAIDALALRLVQQTPITGADFVVRSDVVCRLAPQFTRHIVERVSSTPV